MNEVAQLRAAGRRFDAGARACLAKLDVYSRAVEALIDQEALREALDSGVVGAASLDAYAGGRCRLVIGCTRTTRAPPPAPIVELAQRRSHADG